MTQFIAALPMYDWPEVRAETDTLWAILRDAFRKHGLDAPEDLARCNANVPAVPGGIRNIVGTVIAPDPVSLPPEEFDLPILWRHPLLLLAQTCWGPMEQGLDREVIVVGQPDYSAFEGGEGELYSSAILMRCADAEQVDKSSLAALAFGMRGKRLAFNGPDSMSGLIALERDLQAQRQGFDLFLERIETGSHRASIRAVAEHRADVCTIDCRTWDLAKRFEPAADALTVVGWTAKRKGLPFIASRHLSGAMIGAIREVVASVIAKTASS